MNKQNQLAVVDVDQVLSEYSLDKLDELAPFKRSIMLAKGMSMLRKALDPHMPDLMQLKGSKLGFLCDDGNYSEQQIRDVLMEGMIRGARPVLNEINVIAGGCYLTKEFFHRRIPEIPGVTNLAVETGLPQVLREPSWEKGTDGKNRPVPGSALISMSASWRQNGVPCSLVCTKTDIADTRIPIRLNHKYGIDQILGLAESKLLRRVYKRITGSEWVSEDDVDTSKPDLLEVDEEKVDATDEDFANVVRRKFSRCTTQEQVSQTYRELEAANHDNEDRRQLIMDEASLREQDLAEETVTS